MAYDSSNVRQINYDASWDGKDLGGVDLVKPELDLQFSPVQIGSAGSVILDEIFQGLGGNAKVTVTVREVTLQRMKDLVPWAGSTTPYALTPPPGTKIAQYAKVLKLHPRDVTDTTQDLNFLKAVPVQSFQLERDGVKQDAWAVVFRLFPDPAKLAAGQAAWVTLG
ncbi:MAG: hypothetical protein ACM359_07075 [Bacillota bacterium]